MVRWMTQTHVMALLSHQHISYLYKSRKLQRQNLYRHRLLFGSTLYSPTFTDVGVILQKSLLEQHFTQ
jgi:hypothetical protein